MSFVKKLLIAIGILFVLLIAVALFLPVFVDVNNYKDKIEQLAEDNLGRQLNLKGNLELKTFPTLRVKTGELTLANPEGFPHENMLEVKNAQIGIRVLPLLTKKVEAGTIIIDSPVINLTKKSNGEANWEFPSSAEETETSADDSDSGAALAAIAIQGFEITNAKLSYADFTSDTLVNAEGLNLTTGSIIPGSTFPVELSAIFSGSMLADPVEAKLSMKTNIDSNLSNLDLSDLVSEIKMGDPTYKINAPSLNYDIKNGQLAANQLSVSAPIDDQSNADINIPGFKFDINQSVANINGTEIVYSAADLNATVSLPKLGFDLNNQIATIDSADLKVSNPNFKATLALPETEVDLTEDDLAINGLTGSYTYNDLSGNLSVPQLTFNKKTSQFEVQDVQTTIGDAAIISNLSGGLDPMQVSFGVDTQKLNLKQLFSALDIALDTGSQSALTNLDLNLNGQYQDNSVVVNEFSGKLDETTLSGKASIMDFANPAYDVTVNIGDLAIDDYLPKPGAGESANTGESAAAAAGAPVALSQFNIKAKINANRIYSDANGLSLENLKLGLTPNGDASTIVLNSSINGAAVPEQINIDLTTIAKLNTQQNSATLNDLSLKAKGQTINGGISIPTASIPFSEDNISLANISATFSNAVANAQLKLPRVEFSANNSIVLVEDITGKATFNDINATILLPNLTADLDNQRLKVNELALDLSGKQPVGRLSIPTLDINLSNQTLGSTNIIFEGQDGRAEITLKPTDGSNTYSGNILANNFNLRGILNRFNMLTDLDDKSALTKVNIQSPVTFSESKLKLANLKASIDSTQISGFVDASIGLNPVYNFDINVGNLNADRYIPAAKESDVTNSTKAVGAPVAIPVELFQNTTANGKVHFNKLEIGGAQFNDFNIGVTAKEGRLSISPLESGFFNGRMDGDLAVDSSSSTPKLDFNYTLSQVALEQALSSLGVTNKLAGNGNFSLNMKAAGATDKALISSVNGKAGVKVNNGAIKGVNLQDVLFKGYQAYAALKDKTVNSKYNPSDQTEFSSMTGSWNISGGVISGNDLDIQAPLFRISGGGNVSLVSNTIDYQLNVKVVKSLEGQGGASMKELEGRTIPLSITGNLNNPQYKLDVSSLVRAEVERKAKEKIEEKIEEKLGEKLEGEGSLQEKLQKKAVEKVGEKLFDLFN